MGSLELLEGRGVWAQVPMEVLVQRRDENGEETAPGYFEGIVDEPG